MKGLGASQVATWIDHLEAQPVRATAAHEARAGRARHPLERRIEPGESLLDELTSREREVLELMALDRSNEEIAAELFIAVSTVKTHINHILRKLGETTRIGAVLVYQRLLDLHPST